MSMRRAFRYLLELGRKQQLRKLIWQSGKSRVSRDEAILNKRRSMSRHRHSQHVRQTLAWAERDRCQAG